MFAYIKGTLEEICPDHIVVEAGGLGFIIYMPGGSSDYLPAVGQEVKIHTYFQVREDAFTIFGFLTGDDLELFKMLITVNGIGPRAGLSILSALSADQLRFAILSQDAKAIAKAPGVGAKTAARVILDLKDKVSLEEAFEKKSENQVKTAAVNDQGPKSEAIQALTALGYSGTESLQAVSKVHMEENMTTEDVLKAALKHLALF